MKILFLGGTGRLSKDVARLALETGNEVYLLTRGSENRRRFVADEYNMLYADVRNPDVCSEKIRGLYFDVVVDFLSYDVNNLINKLGILEKHYNQYVFISSATAYKPNQGIIREADAVLGNPDWKYANDKVLCECYLKEYFAGKGDIQYTIIRPYVTYGNTRVPYPIVPFNNFEEWSLVERIKQRKYIPVMDNNKMRTTVTHTRDFAKGLVGAFQNGLAYGQDFHITDDRTTTWEEILDVLGECLNINPNKLYMPMAFICEYLPQYRELLQADKGNEWIFDNSKIKKAVPSFACTTGIESGLREMLEFYEQNPTLQVVNVEWETEIDSLCNAWINYQHYYHI